MISFDDYFDILQDLARCHGENVWDRDAWRQDYENGMSAEQAFYNEYPEHRDTSDDAVSLDLSASRHGGDAKAMANAIGIPLGEWPGRCYEIACAILKAGLVEGRAVHGHYTGPVAPGSYFSDAVIVRHGWIESANGALIDPTRWVFDGVEPQKAYIFMADNATAAMLKATEYDEGGNRFYETFRSARPVPLRNDGDHATPIPAQQEAGARIACGMLGREVTDLTSAEGFFLANTPLTVLRDSAASLYAMLRDMGMEAFIPLDNRLNIDNEDLRPQRQRRQSMTER